MIPDFVFIEDEEDNNRDEDALESSGSLGSCGCIDYHMADCPLINNYESERVDDE